MALCTLPSPRGPVLGIEFAVPAAATPPSGFALLLPGTSIRPGPGADKAQKYNFEPEIPSIYGSVGRQLTHQGLPCLQLCWRRFPADGGTTQDAVNDMLAGICHMRDRYGSSCGALLVGYSFGGAAILQLLAQCNDHPEATISVISRCGKDQKWQGQVKPWLLGCVSLSGALKGQEEDSVSLLSAARYMEAAQSPWLIIHGSEDDNVALSAAFKLFRKAPPLKSLCVLKGGDHNLRDYPWQAMVTTIISKWLVLVGAPRGSSGASRSRATQQAHHAAAADLSELSLQSPQEVACAFEPAPMRLGSGALLPYTMFEVPTLQDVLVSVALHGNDLSQATPAQRQRLDCRIARMAELTSLHSQRQQKARERASRERRGSVHDAYAKLQSSRLKRLQHLAVLPAKSPACCEGSSV